MQVGNGKATTHISMHQITLDQSSGSKNGSEILKNFGTFFNHFAERTSRLNFIELVKFMVERLQDGGYSNFPHDTVYGTVFARIIPTRPTKSDG